MQYKRLTDTFRAKRLFRDIITIVEQRNALETITKQDYNNEKKKNLKAYSTSRDYGFTGIRRPRTYDTVGGAHSRISTINMVRYPATEVSSVRYTRIDRRAIANRTSSREQSGQSGRHEVVRFAVAAARRRRPGVRRRRRFGLGRTGRVAGPVARRHGTGVVRAPDPGRCGRRGRELRVRRERGRRRQGVAVHRGGGVELEGSDRVGRVRAAGHEDGRRRAGRRLRARRASRAVGRAPDQIDFTATAVPVHRPVQRHPQDRLYRIP